MRATMTAGVCGLSRCQFLTNTVTLVANARPGAITNGATAVSPRTTAAQMSADLAGLLAAVTMPGPLVWIMEPTTAYRIAATIGGTAAVDVPHTLFGIPLVLVRE